MPAVSYKPKYKIDDFLLWEGDWELWEGTPVAMAPAPIYFHQQIGSELLGEIRNQLREKPCENSCRAVYESDWHVNENTVVCPDIMVICEKPEGDWIVKPPRLIVEILSPSTREKDLINKRELYAVNGVAFYLIADPDNKSLTLLHLDENGTYREIPDEKAFQLHGNCSIIFDSATAFS